MKRKDSFVESNLRNKYNLLKTSAMISQLIKSRKNVQCMQFELPTNILMFPLNYTKLCVAVKK